MRWPRTTAIALAATLVSAPVVAAGTPADALKAAFLFNFAKFAEWPALLPGSPIVVCIVGSDAVAAAFVATVRGQDIAGHALEVSRPESGGSWRSCNLLFVADVETRQLAKGLVEIGAFPVLTVGDGKGFSQAGGIIELYLEDGKIRFSVNLDAAERAKIRFSSRLLTLAKFTRSGHVQ